MEKRFPQYPSRLPQPSQDSGAQNYMTFPGSTTQNEQQQNPYAPTGANSAFRSTDQAQSNRYPSSRKSRQERKEQSKLKRRNAEEPDNVYGQHRLNLQKGRYSIDRDPFNIVVPNNANPSSDQQKELYRVSNEKNNRHSQYNQSGDKNEEDDVVLKSDNPEREITNIQTVVQTGNNSQQRSNSSNERNQIEKRPSVVKPNSKPLRVAETKSMKRPCLKDFIIDFESINNEMMQNQFDKANILGYGNKFFSNPANQPSSRSSFVNQDRLRGKGSLEDDIDNKKEIKNSPLNARWAKGQDNEGSLAKYFMNKLVKNGNTQVQPLKKDSPVNLQGKDKPLNNLKDQVANDKQTSSASKKPFFNPDAWNSSSKPNQPSFQIKEQNEAPKYSIKQNSDSKAPGSQIRGVSAKMGLKGVGSLKNMRPSYSFMNKNSSVGPSARASTYSQSFQNQFKRSNFPQTNRQNHQNSSINSRFLNPRPDNNLSKNSSIQMQTDRLKNQNDVILEQKSLKSDSYEQVSMGSMGAGGDGVDPKDLKFDKVMGDRDTFVQQEPKDPLKSFINKSGKPKNAQSSVYNTISSIKNKPQGLQSYGSSKTFMRQPREPQKEQKMPVGSYLQNDYSSSPSKYGRKVTNIIGNKAKLKSPHVPNLDLYKTNLSKSPAMNITGSILRKQHYSTKNLHGQKQNDVDTLSNQKKKGMPSPGQFNSKFLSKATAQTKSLGNLQLLKKTQSQIKKDIVDKEHAMNAKRQAYYKKYGIDKKLEQTVEQNKTIAIFAQGQQNRSKTLAFRTSIHDIQEEPSESAAQTYVSNKFGVDKLNKEKDPSELKRRNNTLVPEKVSQIQEKLGIKQKRTSIQQSQSEAVFKGVGGAPGTIPQPNTQSYLTKQRLKSFKSSRNSIPNNSNQAIQSKQFGQGTNFQTKQSARDKLSAKKPLKEAPKTARNTSSNQRLGRKESIVNLTSGKTLRKQQNQEDVVQKQSYQEISAKKLSLQANKDNIKAVVTQGYRQRMYNQNLIKTKKNVALEQQRQSIGNVNDLDGFKTERAPNVKSLGEQIETSKSKDLPQQSKKDAILEQAVKSSATPSSKKPITTSTIDLVNDPIPDTAGKISEKKVVEPVNKAVVTKPVAARKASQGSINLIPKKASMLDENLVKTVSVKVNNDKGIALVKSSANPQGPASSLSGNLTSKSPKSVMTFRSAHKRGSSIEQAETEIKFPLSVEEAKKHFKEFINDFEDQEILKYDGEIYYVGQNCDSKTKGHVIKMVNQTIQPSSVGQRKSSYLKRQSISSSQQVQAIPSERQIERLRQMNIYNYGYDDDQGDYKTVMKDHLGYRYEVVDHLGSGSFGQALRCYDHKTGEQVAVKIIRNKKKFQYQAGMELKILKFLNNNDKFDQNNVIRVYDYLVFREHLIISFELLSINLYEFIRNNNFVGVSQSLIRRFAIQILQALKYQQDHNLVHCDLKPENILLKQQNKSGIKVIDYGSSCFMGQRIYTYIQSRFYRAPEIILGIPYTTAIDMWSFGAIIAELFTGFPLYPGESEVEQLAYIMELYGLPDDEVLKLAQRKHIFFDKNNEPILTPNSRGKIRQPGARTLADTINCTDELFLDFLDRCFKWHPLQRMTPLQALQHPWILEGLPEKVLKHHNKMFGHADNKKYVTEMTFTPIQGFPRSKKDQTIHEIVREIRLADKKREANNERRKSQAQQPDQSKAYEGLQLQKVKSKSYLHESNAQQVDQVYNVKAETQQKKNLSPNKERKTRKQRKEQNEIRQNYSNDLNNSISQNTDKDHSKQGQYQTNNEAEHLPQGEKFGHIKIYEPVREDQIPEEEQSEDGINIQSTGKKRPKSKIIHRPNLFNKRTPIDVFKGAAQREPSGDAGNEELSDNNGEVTEFVGSYEQVQEISEPQPDKSVEVTEDGDKNQYSSPTKQTYKPDNIQDTEKKKVSTAHKNINFYLDQDN